MESVILDSRTTVNNNNSSRTVIPCNEISLLPAAVILEITDTEPQAFIVVRGQNNEACTCQFALVSYENLDHSNILAEFRQYCVGSDSGTKVECLGGGMIIVNHTHKQIKTFGKSNSYGKVASTLLKHIIHQNYPHYRLQILKGY